MKIDESFILNFKKLAKNQNYVFDENDLKILFESDLNQSFYRAYEKLSTLGLLKRFSRGIYIAENFNLIDVNKKINENSYLSFEYVLAKNSLIGTSSNQLLRSVIRDKRSKRYLFQGYRLEQFKICDELYFGFHNIEGYNIATPEKAYLDCLYYYTKGLRFSFDLFSDVDQNMLNKTLLKKYLKKYNNKKFISFAKGLLEHD